MTLFINFTYWKARFIILIFLLLANNLMSCKKFVDIGISNTRITAEAVFNSDMTATAAALGMYETMQRSFSFAASGAPSSISVLSGLLADEFNNYTQANTLFAQNNLNASDAKVQTVWSTAYNTIYAANAVIEGIGASKSISVPIASQLTGEAKFVRAFCHFYLVNLYGNIPLITTTDYRINAIAQQIGAIEVYQQIIKDLEDARQLLDDGYVSDYKARPNKLAATALLARVYLYLKDWAKAEQFSTLLIDHPSLELESNLDDVFLPESQESIWQMASTSPTSVTTWEGYYYVIESTPGFQAISNHLLNAFEANDSRRNNWIGSFTSGSNTWYFPYKYKVGTGSSPLKEYSVVLRLAELYLIRAEARAHLNNIVGAQEDLNKIRNRADLPNTISSDQSTLLIAIEHERQVELFSEWGHRWLDLKRNNRADEVLGLIKADWQSTDVLFPIPQTDLNNNPYLVQNPGY